MANIEMPIIVAMTLPNFLKSTSRNLRFFSSAAAFADDGVIYKFVEFMSELLRKRMRVGLDGLDGFEANFLFRSIIEIKFI